MNVTEINPEKTPDRFFLPRVDGEDTIFDLVNEEQVDLTNFPNALKVKAKKVYDGMAFLAMLADRIQIYWQKDEDETPILIAEAELIGQIWAGGVWNDKTFSFSGAEVQKIDDYYQASRIEDIPALSVTDVLWGLRCHWEHGNVKWEFYADVPGRLIRIIWQARVKDSAIAETDKKGLSFSIADYGGASSHTTGDDAEEGWTWHRWTFEPEGYQCADADERTPQQRYSQDVGLKIDPYISVSESGSDIIITTSGDVITIGDTENAVLTEATSIRAIITEDYYTYTIYDLRMIRWRHDTAETDTDMAGADKGGPYQITGELYWYPLTDAEETANAARTTQLQDIIMAAPSTGTEVTDLVTPESIGLDGFATDGGRHFEMVGKEIEYTSDDATRVGHVDVIEDPPLQTGDVSDPDSQVIGDVLSYGAYFTGNGAVDTAVAHDDVLFYLSGLQDTGEALDIGTGNVTFVSGPSHGLGWDGVTDATLLINSSAERVYAPFVYDVSIFTFACWVKITAETPDAYACFFSHATETFLLARAGSALMLSMDGTLVYLNGVWDVVADGSWHYMVVTADDSTDIAMGYVDGVLIYTRSNTSFTAPTISSGNIYIGNRSGQGWELGGHIQDIYFTNKIGTPQIPVVLGAGPIHAPIQGIA